MKKPIHPPRLANALFFWCCGNAAVEDFEGDLMEIFLSDIRRMPLWKARLRYWKMVFSLIFSYSLKQRRRQSAFHPFSTANAVDMLASYFKVSWRSLSKHRFFTIINVLGLAVGMSISLLFISMVTYISKYDSFHQQKDRIYRITTSTRDNTRVIDFASSPAPLAEKMKSELASIEEIVRISRTLSGNAVTEKKEIPLSGYFADESFFSVFTFPIIKGSKASALVKPMSMVLTEATALKLYGDEDPVGKMITMEPWGAFMITAIMKDHPKASHLQFDAIASYSSLTIPEQRTDDWMDFRNHYTYFQLTDSHSPEDVSRYLESLSTAQRRNFDTDQEYSFAVQSLKDIATGKEHSNEIGPQWGYTSFIIFGVLNLLILLPACFNYANISISRTLKRAREIGLRKTVGGLRRQIFAQFITETVLVTLIALAGAFLIFTQIRGEFLNMLVSGESIELNADAEIIGYFIAFAILTGLVAGVIPALYFSRLNPVDALKNTASLKSVKGISFQKTIVVTQFALSLGFIMGVVIVLKQYRQSLNYNFGFEQANILDVELQDADPERFRNAFAKLASVKKVSMSSGVVGTYLPGSATIRSISNEFDSIVVSQIFADSRYLENLSIPLVAGETFPDTHHSRNEKFIIVNEEFLKASKMPSASAALGVPFLLDDSVEVSVIGVVKNFHYNSLRERIGPMIFRNDPRQFQYANLSIASNDIYSTITEMESVWNSIGATGKFQARFFKDEIAETFSFYFSLIKICGFLGFLAITISCLGLLGMVVYTTENRMKELGIRKVMGATRWHLAMLLSQGYLKLMAIAAIIATPVTYLIFDRMLLQIQYYRFQIGVAEVMISLSIIAILGGATIFSQTIKASESNPVDILKTD